MGIMDEGARVNLWADIRRKALQDLCPDRKRPGYYLCRFLEQLISIVLVTPIKDGKFHGQLDVSILELG